MNGRWPAATKLIGGLAAVALVGVGVWFAMPDDGSPVRVAEPVALVVDEDVGPDPTTALVGPLLGGPSAFHVRYAFSLRAERTIGRIEVDAGGTLEVGNARQVHGQTWVPLRLVGATASMSDAASSRLDAASTHELQRPFAARVMANGKVETVRFSDGVSYTARSVLAEFTHALQFARPEGDKPTWRATEKDANGSYSATYHRDDWRVVRTVKSPEDRIGERSLTKTTFEFDGARARSIDLQREGKATTGGIQVARFVPMKLQIEARRAQRPATDWAASMRISRLRPFDSRDAIFKHAAAPPPRDFQRVMKETVDKAGQLDVGGRTNLRNELTHALRQQPGAVGDIDRVLRTRELDYQSETIAIAALVGARTGAAQATVARMLHDDGVGRDLRVRVLQSAALMSSPSAAFVSSLMEVAVNHTDPAYAAAAAATAGASAHFLAERHPAQAAAAVAALVKTAGPIVRSRRRPARPNVDGTSPPQPPVGVRLNWLAGLGNTGAASALPDIMAALDEPNEAVRGGAVIALRFQSPTKCISKMVKMMATDKSIHVRENIVDAARHMGPAVTGQLVERALRFDESPFVRLAAAYTLSVWSADAPGLRSILVDALKREKNTRVIEAIQHFVDQGRISGKYTTGSQKMGAP